MMDIGALKKKLTEGRPTVGGWMQIPSSDVAEIMGRAGYDWVAVDMEHGAFSNQILPDIFRALELGGTLPMVRLGRVGKLEIKKALDSGARGLIFPMVENGTQLARAISSSLYPPAGERGVGFSRANLFGKHFEDYRKNADQLILVAQIEHINAVNALDDILAVDGLDAIIVGPYDLSGSMDLTAQFDHPRFIEALVTIREASKRHGVPMGLHIVEPDEETLRSKIADGYQFVAYGTDAVFLNAGCGCPVFDLEKKTVVKP
ncbi:MAG: 2,4-dihydroxyhept-2-ene-1,7-dioic acid aldolase [Desulfobacterales bacterium]|nr:2,4-dihydroxyhept-2-ene-1,7-dioic acid aldolase [Desulfobacterales bacterium]